MGKIKDVFELCDKRARWFYNANGKLSMLKTFFYLADLVAASLIGIFLPSRHRERNFLKDPDMDLVKRYIVNNNLSRDQSLDIGCAWGRVSIVLFHLGFHVTAIDKEPRRSWNEINLDFVRGDAHNLPFENSIFDLVTCYEVLEHVSNDEEVIEEIYRVLKRGSTLLVQVPNGENLYKKIMGRKLSPRHKREHTVEQITDLLTSVGFKIERAWMEGFYAPIFTLTNNNIVSWDKKCFLGNLLPSRLRGIITIVCKK